MSTQTKITLGKSHKLANEVWDYCSESKDTFLYEYYEVKTLKGTRITEEDGVAVPMNNQEGILVNVLTIHDDGSFEYIKGCLKSKVRFEIGAEIVDGEPIFVVDTFLEGITIFEATLTPVVVVFFWNNIEGMVNELRKKYPNSWIYIVNYQSKLGPRARNRSQKFLEANRLKWDSLCELKHSVENKILSLAVLNERKQERLSLYDLFVNGPFNQTLGLLQFLLLEAVNNGRANNKDDLCYDISQFSGDKHELRRTYLEGFIIEKNRIGKLALSYKTKEKTIGRMEQKQKKLEEKISQLEEELSEKGKSTQDMRSAALLKRNDIWMKRYFELDGLKFSNKIDTIFKEYQDGGGSAVVKDTIRRFINEYSEDKKYLRGFKERQENNPT
jgi:hypothetical protein